MADRVRLGTAALTRVVESGVDGLPRELFVQTPVAAWNDLDDDFQPVYWNPGGWRIALQTWVIEIDGLTVLVDTVLGTTATGREWRRSTISVPLSSSRFAAPVSNRQMSTSSSTRICTLATAVALATTPAVAPPPMPVKLPTVANVDLLSLSSALVGFVDGVKATVDTASASLEGGREQTWTTQYLTVKGLIASAQNVNTAVTAGVDAVAVN